MLSYKAFKHQPTLKHLSHTGLHHAPSDPLVQLELSHNLLGYKEGMHQGSSLSWHPRGGTNLPWLSKQLSDWLPSNEA